MKKRSPNRDCGASLVEYAAVIILVSVILGALIPVLQGPVSEGAASAVQRILNLGEDSGSSSSPRADQQEHQENNEPMPNRQEQPDSPKDKDVPVPDGRPKWPDIDEDSVWPSSSTVYARSTGNESDPEGENTEPKEGGSAPSVDVPEDESPLFKDPGPHPSQSVAEASHDDYESLGTEEEADCVIGFPPSDSCYVRNQVNEVIFLAELCVPGLDKYCLPRSAGNFDHFLNGNGEKMDIDMGQLMSDVPEFSEEVDGQQEQLGKKAIKEAQERGANGPITFPISTSWDDYGYPPGARNGANFVYKDKDWSNAIGSWHYNMTGEVTAIPPEKPGGEWSYEMNTDVNLKKYYDWERNNTNPAMGSPQNLIYDFSQKDLSDLHRNGLAQEYWIEGSTNVEKRG